MSRLRVGGMRTRSVLTDPTLSNGVGRSKEERDRAAELTAPNSARAA
jgi:hypothetical protein